MLSTNCSKDPIHSEDRGKIPGRHVWQPSLWRGQTDVENEFFKEQICLWRSFTFLWNMSNFLALSDGASVLFSSERLDILAKASDQELRERMTQLPGIGEWTLETWLKLSMHRKTSKNGREAEWFLSGSGRAGKITPPSTAFYSMTTASGKLWILLEGNEAPPKEFRPWCMHHGTTSSHGKVIASLIDWYAIFFAGTMLRMPEAHRSPLIVCNPRHFSQHQEMFLIFQLHRHGGLELL